MKSTVWFWVVIMGAMAVSPSATWAGFTDNGNGTVSDSTSGLVWQQTTAPGQYLWGQALAYCEGLNLGDATDWRLPDRNELQSLVDYSRSLPSIDTTFFPYTNTTSPYYSSTTAADDSSRVWCVSFYDGNVDALLKSESGYKVRCVRGGM